MSRHSLEIAEGFIAEAPASVQIMGGVGSFALRYATEVLPDERLVVVSADVFDEVDYSVISQFRPDGTRRDFDILVKDTDPKTIAAVEAQAQAVIGDELTISVFGLHSMNQLRQQQANPLASLARVWLSDRYVTMQDGRITEAQKALYPFAVAMPLDSLETWHVIIGNDTLRMPIAHPGAAVINYLIRSISGMRPKDAEKTDAHASNLFQQAPELVDWIIDGPGQSQLELARILHTLRSPLDPVGRRHSLEIGGKLVVDTLPADSLMDHPAMLIKDDLYLAAFATAFSRDKARALHTVERHHTIVSAYQRYVEQWMGAIVGNR